MDQLGKIAKEIQALILDSESDARAEMILTEILAGELSVDQLYVLPQGLLNRPFKRDIFGVAVNDQLKTRMDVYTSREGIYDYLPKGIFFPLHDNTTRTKAIQMTANVRRNKTIEANARKFFAPFDTIFALARIEAEQQGRSLSDIAGEGNFGPLGMIWELPEAMDLREKSLLIMLLPFSRTISAKPDLLSGLYSLFFNVNFTISAPENNVSVDDCQGAALNDCHLGYSSVLGGALESVHTQVSLDYEIDTTSQLASFAPGSRNDQLLDYLNNLFLLVDTEIHKKPDASAIKNELTLDENNPLILGYSTYLQDDSNKMSSTENGQ